MSNPDFFTNIDLVPAQIVLSLSGAFLSMWYMQVIGNEATGETRSVRCVRRVGIFLIACGLLWSVNFAYYNDWQPWPPYILVLIGLNASLTAGSINATRLVKRYNAARREDVAKRYYNAWHV